jgi:hypothetical protein
MCLQNVNKGQPNTTSPCINRMCALTSLRLPALACLSPPPQGLQAGQQGWRASSNSSPTHFLLTTSPSMLRHLGLVLFEAECASSCSRNLWQQQPERKFFARNERCLPTGFETATACTTPLDVRTFTYPAAFPCPYRLCHLRGCSRHYWLLFQRLIRRNHQP